MLKKKLKMKQPDCMCWTWAGGARAPRWETRERRELRQGWEERQFGGAICPFVILSVKKWIKYLQKKNLIKIRKKKINIF
jgi:hypothetical protein